MSVGPCAEDFVHKRAALNKLQLGTNETVLATVLTPENTQPGKGVIKSKHSTDAESTVDFPRVRIRGWGEERRGGEWKGGGFLLTVTHSTMNRAHASV